MHLTLLLPTDLFCFSFTNSPALACGRMFSAGKGIRVAVVVVGGGIVSMGGIVTGGMGDVALNLADVLGKRGVEIVLGGTGNFQR